MKYEIFVIFLNFFHNYQKIIENNLSPYEFYEMVNAINKLEKWELQLLNHVSKSHLKKQNLKKFGAQLIGN